MGIDPALLDKAENPFFVQSGQGSIRRAPKEFSGKKAEK